MSVNFYKNRDQMVAAYKEVIDENSKINWALFGYEKQTNDLTLVDKGEGGLEELSEEFNSSKILYAFCRVKDPNTELIKNVIINWQGEGAPLQRKGICINHFRDICDFFKGAHLTINARTEDEVEPQVILSKVSKVSVKVNLKDRLDLTENPSPVGSTYKRVQPQREISQTDREEFWVKSQEEEKLRQIEEKKRLNERRAQIEKERQEREIREAKGREASVREREEQINKLREAERNAINSNKMEAKPEAADDNERRHRSEQLRRQRAEEVKAAISQSSIRNTRAIFEQNSSAGQMNTNRSASQSNHKLISSRKELFESNEKPPKTVESVKVFEKKSIDSNINGKHSVIESQPLLKEEPEVKEIEPKVEEVISHSVVVTNQIINETEAPPEDTTEDNTNGDYDSIDEAVEREVESEVETRIERSVETHIETDLVYTRNLLQETYLETRPLEDIAEEQTWEESNNPEEEYDSTQNVLSEQNDSNGIDSGLKKARALFDYQAADETEISFDPDDIITHIEQIDSGWWQGLAPDGTYGLFPANYVELID